uniref:Uncharacterized protein n=1 Tax=Glossina morsitans morsitans TaxID=37546 RepID=A0A1B0FN90_GLOMM
SLNIFRKYRKRLSLSGEDRFASLQKLALFSPFQCISIQVMYELRVCSSATQEMWNVLHYIEGIVLSKRKLRAMENVLWGSDVHQEFDHYLYCPLQCHPTAWSMRVWCA